LEIEYNILRKINKTLIKIYLKDRYEVNINLYEFLEKEIEEDALFKTNYSL